MKVTLVACAAVVVMASTNLIAVEAKPAEAALKPKAEVITDAEVKAEVKTEAKKVEETMKSEAETVSDTEAKPSEEAPKPKAEIISDADADAKTPRIFDQLDKNQDGKVSQQEAQVSPALVKGFEKIDSNNDGFLSLDEFSQLQVEAPKAPTYVVLASLQAL